MDKELMEQLFNQLVGIKTLIWIQAEEIISDALGDLIGEGGCDELLKLLGFETDDPDLEEVITTICYRYPGFLIAEVHTPVRRKRDSGGESFSWGHTHYTVILAKDLQDLGKQALEWAAKKRKEKE